MNWGRDISRDEIVAAARTWIGTPYRHLGRDRKYIDCIGFVWAVPRGMGLAVPDIPSKYTRFPKTSMLIEGCERTLVRKEPQGIERIQPGDVLVLWGWERGEAQHFAIVGRHPMVPAVLTMIHAFEKREQVVEHSIDEFWKERYVATYEYPGTVG
jgi:NlpC/P60 family putative phage cell wall peptidase